VASLARPGGNVTGLTDMAPQLTGKRLELLQAVVPNTVRVGVLWNVDYAAATVAWTETRDAARVLALEPVPLGVRTGADLERVFETSSREVEAMLVLMDPLLLGERARIVDLAAQYGLPVMYPSPDFTAAGGLMTYGANHDDLFRRLAVYVDKILKGAKPADLPVEQPMTFEFIINAKAAQALGLTIPQQVLLQATEVIQ
jgi:putative ABC transport system substrate-binding protein